MTAVDGRGELVLGLIREAVASVLEVDPSSVTRGTRLVEDLGADSLALVEIVEIVEERLLALGHDVHVDDEVLEDLATVGDAVDSAVARL